MNDQSIAQVPCLGTRIFHSLVKNDSGFLTTKEIKTQFYELGIEYKNQKLKKFFKNLDILEDQNKITVSDFSKAIKDDLIFLEKILHKNLVIPDFKNFCDEITEIFEKTKANKDGKVASYIPQLGRVNPEKYAVSICTIDGQQFHLGDINRASAA